MAFSTINFSSILVFPFKRHQLLKPYKLSTSMVKQTSILFITVLSASNVQNVNNLRNYFHFNTLTPTLKATDMANVPTYIIVQKEIHCIKIQKQNFLHVHILPYKYPSHEHVFSQMCISFYTLLSIYMKHLTITIA